MPAPAFSNLNLPAPLAALAFLGAIGGTFVGLAAAAVAWFARRPKVAKVCVLLICVGAVLYAALLFGFSEFSRAHFLVRGQEKFFCEIDCHLAYSIIDVKNEPVPGSTHYVVTVRTRFDENTISATRPRDASLTPSPRTVYLIDNAGHQYLPTTVEGTPLLTPLRPSESYSTQLGFDVPAASSSLRLLITTTPSWPDLIVIGDENSLFHKKTYFLI
jgi:hypothetical protein